MSSRISTILILGAGRGIGEALVRRFHSLGKRVIATGREHDREKLSRLSQDLPGLEYRVWDLTDFDNLNNKVQGILADFPNLDSVYINAGIQNHHMIFEEPTNQKDVIREMTTNLLSPVLVAQYFAPHLLKLAKSGTYTNIFLTSSSLAYFPVPFYPAYCPTKAGIAAFAKVMRMQLEHTGCKNMNVIEVVPPYVGTDLNAAHRQQTDALQGGPDKAIQPMPLSEYIDSFFDALEQTGADNSFKNEIGVGFGAQGAKVWNEGFQKLLNSAGMTD